MLFTALLSGAEKDYLAQIQADEEFHVTALTQTIQQIGGTPVEKPWVDFGGVFADRSSYLTTSVTFENVGVGAYLGAAGYIKDKTILQAAAGIFGAEAPCCRGRRAAEPARRGRRLQGGRSRPRYPKADVLTAVAPFLMNQMGTVPAGSVDTGGGGAAVNDQTGLLAVGDAALLGAAGAAVYATRHRPDSDATTPPDPAA